ncbi:MAG: HAMP domain-containing histidine kinase [Bacteroidaceae bacterium]|nr:HAMP domain-containing histidine kinase [Bacteroidaceae bacterium]
MNWFDRIRNIKFLLVTFAVFIAIVSLVTSNYLIQDLKAGEINSVEVWAEAMRSLNNADENTDLNLVLKVINGNKNIPVIVKNRAGDVIAYRNIENDYDNAVDSIGVVNGIAKRMSKVGSHIRLDLPDVENEDGTQVKDWLDIYYDESLMLKRLQVYPFVQLTVVVIFVMVSIFALFAAARAEQNKVWVGLSKETAHQLGTPISSLMAWYEVLKETYPNDALIPEMENDIKRLERIADRFSKIGSLPEPKPEELNCVVERVAEYMDHRTSNKVKIEVDMPSEPVIVSLVPSLFEWVIENLCKNAVDAMEGSGNIFITVSEDVNFVVVEVRDTGKGIAKSNFENVFKPGFTTKQRGWGLGLSLVRRIVEQYHKGKIFVKSSELGVGTTFRIELARKQ